MMADKRERGGRGVGLAAFAASRIKTHCVPNFSQVNTTYGWRKCAPFALIIVTRASATGATNAARCFAPAVESEFTTPPSPQRMWDAILVPLGGRDALARGQVVHTDHVVIPPMHSALQNGNPCSPCSIGNGSWAR